MFNITRASSGEDDHYRLQVVQPGAHKRFERVGWSTFAAGGYHHTGDSVPSFEKPSASDRVDDIEIGVRFYETNHENERVYFGHISGASSDRRIEVEVYLRRHVDGADIYRVEMYDANGRNHVKEYTTGSKYIGKIRVRPFVIKAFKDILSEDQPQ